MESLTKTGFPCQQYPVFNSQCDTIQETHCTKSDSEDFFNINCLNRDCARCGVEKVPFLHEVLDTSEAACNVTWEKFDYITNKSKGN